MARALFRALFSLIGSVIGIILAPIDLLVSTLFPDIANLLNRFYFIESSFFSYLHNYFGYFVSFIPPFTKGALIVFLGVLVSTYTATLTIHLTLKLFRIIHNIKFW